MNKASVSKLMKALKWIEAAKVTLEEVLDKEQIAYDNMPESFQDCEKGEEAAEAIDKMESALSSTEEVMEYINEILT